MVRRLALILLVPAMTATGMVSACGPTTADQFEAEAARQDETRHPKIVNGEKVKPGGAPWQVALLREDRRNTVYAQFCGGTLIAPNYILTAAHCFQNFSHPESQVKVYAEALKLDGSGRRIAIERYIPHSRYDPVTKDYDAALLKLAEPVNAPTAVLPTGETEARLVSGYKLWVSGWGYTSDGGVKSYDLLQVEVVYVRTALCQNKESYGSRVSDRMLCADRSESAGDACQGDSGGPLVDHQGNVLVGIVSWGEGCAVPLKYGVYTRVAALMTWIRDHIGSTAAMDMAENGGQHKSL